MMRPSLRGQATFFRSPFVLALVAILAGLIAVRWWVLRADAAGGALQPRPELLVAPEWLAGQLAVSGLRIVDLRSPDEYAAGHIPGAVHLSSGALFTERDGVKAMLPDAAALQSVFRQAGIAADTVVVGYDANDGLLAARLFMALDTMGHPGARVLDGGWPAWQAGGHPVSSEPVTPAPSDVVLQPRPGTIAGLDWMREHLNDAAAVYVDARSPAEYLGERSGSARAGHVPGAVSLEWTEHLDPAAGKRLKSPEDLLALYTALGVTPDKQVATYCQSHVRAAHSYFTLKWLGYPDVRAYDGSWHEWGNRDDTPIETGPPQSALPPAQPGQVGGTAEAGASDAGNLEPGMTLAQARSLLGPPDEVEEANPCWGRQTTWRFTGPRAGGGALQLIFLDGVLSEIRR